MYCTHLIATFGDWTVLMFVAIRCAAIAFPGCAVLLSAFCWAPGEGYCFLARYGRFLRLDERKLKLGQYLILEHGGSLVVLGRFVSVSRTSEAFLAGVNQMR